MKTIGIRELRQRASEVLRMAERGETFEVTDRGRAVALITPLPSATALDRMRATCDVSTPTGDIGDLPSPPAFAPAPRGSPRRSSSPGCVRMSADRATYLDSSAIVKLVVREPESAALLLYLRRRTPIVSSALSR